MLRADFVATANVGLRSVAPPGTREGLPVPQEPAYAAERRQDAEAKAASERAKNRMFVASVRRRGMGSPEPTPVDVNRRSGARARRRRILTIRAQLMWSANCASQNSPAAARDPQPAPRLMLTMQPRTYAS